MQKVDIEIIDVSSYRLIRQGKDQVKIFSEEVGNENPFEDYIDSVLTCDDEFQEK